MYQQSEKNSLNSNISSICPHNTVKFGPLTAEIGWRIWCTRANFNGFCMLASLLHRRRSTEVNQTLHDVWPSPGLVHYIYIFEGTCELMEFCEMQNSLCVQVLHSPILAALLHALQQCMSAKLCSMLRQGATWYFWWRRGVAVTSLGVSTKLLYVGPG